MTMDHIDDEGFKGLGIETWDDFTVYTEQSQLDVQVKNEQLTPTLFKSILSTHPLRAGTHQIVTFSMANSNTRSLLRYLDQFRRHRLVNTKDSLESIAVEGDFDELLSRTGFECLKDALMSTHVEIVPEDGLDSRVKALFTIWARKHHHFINEDDCLHSLLGLFSTARTQRTFLSRSKLFDELSRHTSAPKINAPVASFSSLPLDSEDGLLYEIQQRGTELITRIQTQAMLARAHEKQGSLDRALEIYKYLAQLIDDSEWLFIRCATLCEIMNYFEQAEGFARHALRLNQRSFGALFILGTLVGQHENFDEALGYFNAALSINKENGALLHNIGYAYHMLGDADSAISFFRRATIASPDFAPAHLNLGVALFSRGVYPDALSSIEMALQLEPNMPEALCQRGEIYRFYGELDKAIPLFERALLRLPKNVVALHGLGLSRLERGDLGGIELLAERYKDILQNLHPGHSTLVIDIGWLRSFFIRFLRIDEDIIQVLWDGGSSHVSCSSTEMSQ
ncbi:tetratricopeptide repeat protein [Chromobacterium piscinae]|uniref:tetratricopeptide repeat protein n=1 Tax=Chromobacterium piscinae TaxID=686831 RepID=UPI001E3F43E1|nr:tetratricopeptide repeat protein [Chromobacterium piscinae]MCD4504779.1 tetratricopeptide repeat protein [Chromobacterium piscinae]